MCNLQVYFDAGLAITAVIAVKLGTAHGQSRPEVGSTKRIDAYGRKGVRPAPRIFGTSGKRKYDPYCIFWTKPKILLAYYL